MSRLQRDTGRKSVDKFMDVVTDHMDLDFEEKNFLHEEAHNIYNKVKMDAQSQLQELWGKVEELRFERDYNSISEQYKRGNDDCIEYVLQLIKQLQED